MNISAIASALMIFAESLGEINKLASRFNCEQLIPTLKTIAALLDEE